MEENNNDSNESIENNSLGSMFDSPSDGTSMFDGSQVDDDIFKEDTPKEDNIEENIENQTDTTDENAQNPTAPNFSDIMQNVSNENIQAESGNIETEETEQTISDTNEQIPNEIETNESDTDTSNSFVQEITQEETNESYISDDNTTDNPNALVTVRPVKFQSFDKLTTNLQAKKNIDIMQDISMHISVELGQKKSTIKEIINIHKGSLVELNKIAGEQVEIYANDKLVAKGEVIVIEDKFGVRVTSTNIPKKQY